MTDIDLSNATPRPWMIGLSDADFSIDFPDSEGLTTITHVMARDRVIPVAIVVDDRPFDLSLSDAEFDANAALIVLAVNSYDAMLAALKMVEARLDPIGADDGPMWQQIRAAIRLAEGKDNA